MSVTVSNGTYKFHLSILASELDSRGSLKRFITAGYPRPWLLAIAKRFGNHPRIARLIDRREKISDGLIFSIQGSEVIFKVGDLIFAKISPDCRFWFHRLAFRFYKLFAAINVLFNKPEIYHYRNCYGGASVKLAQRNGIVTICDHSIAHPALIDYLIENKGRWPAQEQLSKLIKKMGILERCMYEDLNNGDHIVVNSEFVRESLIRAGTEPERISVVYLGVDDAYLSALLPRQHQFDDAATVLYAGGWQRRKGVYDLMQAFSDAELCGICKLEVVGGADAEVLADPEMKNFLESDFVKWHGILPRKDLATLMSKRRIFVFPSYCEGSARVVFEALAAGLFVITTPNAGSIVEHEVNGLLVEPGNVEAIKAAIKRAVESPDWVEEVGRRNSGLIVERYTQRHYADEMQKIYVKLLAAS